MAEMDPEQAVDAMIQRGREIVREAIATYKPIAVFAAYSGGNDSIVSTHFACTEFAAEVVHCNTGIGIEETRNHVRRTAAKNDWTLHEKHAKPAGKPAPLDPSILPAGVWTDGDTAYEEYVLNFGFPGPAQHPRMYQRLKERPLDELRREAKQGQHRNACILMVSGIRHDESAIRAGYQRAIQKDNSIIWVNPFYFQTKVDFAHYRDEFGLPVNPVSGQIGISGECLCGAYAKPGEKELIRKVDPATVAYIESLEQRVQANGYPWCWGERPPPWFLNRQKDRKSGQRSLFEAEDAQAFQPMCVGCPRRMATAE